MQGQIEQQNRCLALGPIYFSSPEALETLVDEGFDSVAAFRLAEANDLVGAGFEPDAAEDLLRALRGE